MLGCCISNPCQPGQIRVLASVQWNWVNSVDFQGLCFTQAQVTDAANKANAAFDALPLEDGFNVTYEGQYIFPRLVPPNPPEPPWLNERLGDFVNAPRLLSRSAIGPEGCRAAFGIERSVRDNAGGGRYTSMSLSKARISCDTSFCVSEFEFTTRPGPDLVVVTSRINSRRAAGIYNLDPPSLIPVKIGFNPVFPGQWDARDISGSHGIIAFSAAASAPC